MKISINEGQLLVDINHFAPEKAKQLAENILNLNNSLHVLLVDRAKISNKVKCVAESQQILTSIISNFLSLFQFTLSLFEKGEGKEILKRVMNDLINLEAQASHVANDIFSKPDDRISSGSFIQMERLISTPILSLILPPLIAGWKASKQKINSNLIECDENIFYEIFHEEVLKLSGLHQLLQVFRMPTKTLSAPVLSPGDKREMVLGLYSEMKNEQKSKEELQKNLPAELIESKEESETKSEEKSEEISEEESEEEYEEKGEEED